MDEELLEAGGGRRGLDGGSSERSFRGGSGVRNGVGGFDRQTSERGWFDKNRDDEVNGGVSPRY